LRRFLPAVALCALALFSIGWFAQTPKKPSPKQQLMRANNLGVAYLNQQKLDQALKQFEQAVAADKDNATAQLNLGIALLNLAHAPQAEEALQRAGKLDPKNPAVWFNLGLLHRNNGQADQAIADFSQAAELAPNDTYAHYFLGDVYSQQQKYPQAEKEFRRAVELDPVNVSAEFGLAGSLRRQGKVDDAKPHFERFQKLTREKLGSPISQIYGEQGPLSLAKVVPGEPAVPPAIPLRFVEVGKESGLPTAVNAALAEKNRNTAGIGICVYDMNGDGLPDIVVPHKSFGERLYLDLGVSLYINRGKGRFEDVTKGSGLEALKGVVGCAIGDYDNDGKPDIAINSFDRVWLLHNDGNGKFHDATGQAGINVTGYPTALTFVDYDHDGDLDLYVLRQDLGIILGGAEASPRSKSNVLFRNNGNGTFTDVSEETGLSAGFGSAGVIASDVNNDRAIDLVLSSSPPTIFMNPREGKFHSVPLWKQGGLGSPVGVVALDFNKDGWMDLAFTHVGPPGITLWRNVDGKRFEKVQLPNLNWKRAWGLAALDYDNDGWIDLAAVGETDRGFEIRLFRNLGPKGFEDVTLAVGLDKVELHAPHALVAGDIDGDGATDLLITQTDASLVVLRNDGGNKNHSLRLSLKGLNDNRSAFGTKVTVFAGESQQKWEIAGSSGYLAQGPAEVLAGLGQETQADVVRMLWPTGVYQDEIELAANKPHEILEIDRRGSSCPILFAWNGSRYEFITDVIGAAVIGHWVGPNERDLPDPDEYIKVDGSRVQPRNGRLSFTFAEPMEEVNYLDQARLVAVDHPANTNIYPNERFVATPPFPDFRIITAQRSHAPAGAWDDAGRDVLPALLAHDHKYVTGFKLLHFAGFAEPHSLVLDLGQWDASRPLHLLLDGFTEYFTANSMYAAYQANIAVAAPYIEAQEPDGSWRRVIDDMGFPAGLPRTITVDLTSKIKSGTRKIRIVTNLQIYWDQALIDNSAPDHHIRTTDVPLAAAQLHFHGYPRADESRFRGDLNYTYENVSLTGPYARHIGSYTRYGNVLPLLSAADDRFVVFGSGEEVVLDFDPSSLPKLPTGWKRDYLFYANGFVKDMDFYAADAFTVDPLPFHKMGVYPQPPRSEYPVDERSLEYLLEYNTRYQSGNGVSEYRYVYP